MRHQPESTWTIALAVVIVLSAFFAFGVPLAVPLIAAESLAEKLAPQLAVDEDQLRTTLADGLSETAHRNAIANVVPYVVLLVLLLLQQRAGRRREAETSKQQAV